MLARLSFLACAVLAAPAFAQPAAKSKDAAAASAPDDLADFQKELDALFTAGGLTADQAAARAANASPTVRRKIAEVEAAIAQGEQAELQRVPQLTAKLAASKLSPVAPFSEALGTLGTFQISFINHLYDAQANLTVPLSDYVLRYPKLVDAAHLAEAVAKVSRRDAEVSAGEDARLAYYEWLRAQLQVLIARRQLVNVQATLGQFRALAEVQRLSKADLMRVESQEAEAEQTVDQLTNLSTLREEQLRLMIGAGDDEKLTLGEDVRGQVSAPGQTKLDELVTHAVEHRLDLKTLKLGIEAKDKQTEAETANQYPKLSAFGTIEDANPNPRIFPQSDTFTFTWVLGAQISWALGDTLNSMTNKKRLHAEANELRADQENLLRGTRIELLTAQQAVALAVHSLSTTQKGLEAADESYRVRRELLAADRATAVELVDAQTDLTRARIAALNARVDLRVALTQLNHALGDDAAASK